MGAIQAASGTFNSDDMMTPKSVSMVFGLLPYDYLKRARAGKVPGPPWYLRNGLILYERSEVVSFIQSLRRTA